MSRPAAASYCTFFNTRLGWMGLVASVAGLMRVILPRPSKQAVLQLLKEYIDETKVEWCSFGDLPYRLRCYFSGEPVNFTDSLDLTGSTSFQQSTWQTTCSILYGETRSYAYIARQIGNPQASRAVGQALAKNPLPIVIPCHRVINHNGSPGGFSAGPELKKYLLEMEVLSSCRT